MASYGISVVWLVLVATAARDSARLAPLPEPRGLHAVDELGVGLAVRALGEGEIEFPLELVVIHLGRPRQSEVGDELDGPGVVADGVGDDELVDPFRRVGGEPQSDAAADVVGDERRPLLAEFVEQSLDHCLLGPDGAVEPLAGRRVAVPQ